MNHDHHHHHAVVIKPPHFSLLRLSLLERLLGVAAIVAVLWAIVFWALQ